MLNELAKFVQENSIHNTYVCCMEESAELIQSLSKVLRNSESNIIEELGHVLLMCKVVQLNLKISDEEILFYSRDAVERLAKKLNIDFKL